MTHVPEPPLPPTPPIPPAPAIPPLPPALLPFSQRLPPAPPAPLCVVAVDPADPAATVVRWQVGAALAVSELTPITVRDLARFIGVHDVDLPDTALVFMTADNGNRLPVTVLSITATRDGRPALHLRYETPLPVAQAVPENSALPLIRYTKDGYEQAVKSQLHATEALRSRIEEVGHRLQASAPHMLRLEEGYSPIVRRSRRGTLRHGR